ncbi:helix-turn-helix domain-containing protein [Curtanaerobium respiraculi]|uniref:helix-turn-helix domain-containing protein n=1 Tax=Curtanaerobium respiraculi TaxID=2949669 RepID=UPI0024B379F1|nr:helix-turn-helix domain-containing protein [Curtanaerobium respiraculi]
MPFGATSGFAPLADDAGVYLPTGPGDAQRMELLNMPGDGSDVWLDVRSVQLYLQISNTSIYKLIHAGEIPAVKLGAKTIRVNRRALEEYLQRAQEPLSACEDGDGAL